MKDPLIIYQTDRSNSKKGEKLLPNMIKSAEKFEKAKQGKTPLCVFYTSVLVESSVKGLDKIAQQTEKVINNNNNN